MKSYLKLRKLPLELYVKSDLTKILLNHFAFISKETEQLFEKKHVPLLILENFQGEC